MQLLSEAFSSVFTQVQMQDLFVENDGLDALRNEVHLWRLNRQPEG